MLCKIGFCNMIPHPQGLALRGILIVFCTRFIRAPCVCGSRLYLYSPQSEMHVSFLYKHGTYSTVGSLYYSRKVVPIILSKKSNS
jgi:hypothetical protein